MTLAPSSHTPPRRRRWRLAVALAGAFVMGGVASAGLAVAAEGMAMHHMVMGDPAAMHGRAMAHLSRMMDEVGASAEQKARIETILRAGFAPMDGLHDEMARTHATLHAILTAPRIDRAALEQLRAAEVARLDQSSRSMVAAVADAAEVLTPEQRAKLAALVAERHKPS